MAVTVREPVDSTTVDLQAIPNPLNPSFVDVYVIARRALEGSPIVLSSFAGLDTTVTLTLIEDDLTGRGVLIWAGNMQLAANLQGTIFFTARALTALGTNIEDTTSVAVSTVFAGKAVAFRHNGVAVDLAADAVSAGTQILLQHQQAGRSSAGKAVAGIDDELELLSTVKIYPAGLSLAIPGNLRFDDAAGHGHGVYRRVADGWSFVGRGGESATIQRLGTFGLLRDLAAPRLELLTPAAQLSSGMETTVLEARVVESGSGVDASSLVVEVDGRLSKGSFAAGLFRWKPDAGLGVGTHTLALRVGDRVGNVGFAAWSFFVAAPVLPESFELGHNFPNPFNPNTAIPFSVPASVAGEIVVRLDIYNAAGQLLRRLLDENEIWEPGLHQIDWDGQNQVGQPVGSGVYFYRFQVGGQVMVRRMTLLK